MLQVVLKLLHAVVGTIPGALKPSKSNVLLVVRAERPAPDEAMSVALPGHERALGKEPTHVLGSRDRGRRVVKIGNDERLDERGAVHRHRPRDGGRARNAKDVYRPDEADGVLLLETHPQGDRIIAGETGRHVHGADKRNWIVRLLVVAGERVEDLEPIFGQLLLNKRWLVFVGAARPCPALPRVGGLDAGHDHGANGFHALIPHTITVECIFQEIEQTRLRLVALAHELE
mmetsp:Transcript_22232/g.57101  ORF Transcript_22232/g.57101 Transcript_22232/m.57101 type:complete len:231 (+) Transcript_22232:401-1093(+)